MDCPGDPHHVEREFDSEGLLQALTEFASYYFEKSDPDEVLYGLSVWQLVQEDGVVDEEEWWQVAPETVYDGLVTVGLSARFKDLKPMTNGGYKSAAEDSKLMVQDIKQVTELTIRNYGGVQDLSTVLVNQLTPPDATIVVIPLKRNDRFDAIVQISYRSEPYLPEGG